jgi:predicted Zn-dependent protease
MTLTHSATVLGRAVILVFACGLASSACTGTTRTRTETAATNILLPPEDEAKLGEQFKAELAKQVRFSNDPRVTGYVNEVAQKVFQAARNEAPNLAVKVHVIDDPKTVNAFATPGSQLYVYTGLLLAANDEAELAGVLGHETGHIVARHPARQMVDQFGLETLASIVLGRNASDLTRMAASAASQGYLLANSRSDETEADEFGARFSSRASFDPNALGQFLQRISKGEPPGVLVFLSDHPTTPARVSHLQQYIAQNHLTGQRGDTSKLAAVKQTLSGGVGGGPKSP